MSRMVSYSSNVSTTAFPVAEGSSGEKPRFSGKAQIFLHFFGLGTHVTSCLYNDSIAKFSTYVNNYS